MIYADHAATTKLSAKALDSMLPWLKNAYANPSQPYSFSRSAKKAIENARETIAACIHAGPDEIFMTSGGTESNNWAIKGTAFSCFAPGVLITSAIEHHSVLRACEAMAKQSWQIIRLKPSKDGVILPESLTAHIGQNTRLVSIMMANNELGTIQPIQKYALIAHQYGALFHTDAVQVVGHIPINADALQMDMLSASAHKFNGPKGTGFLYIRKGTRILPYADGGSQEAGYRAGTENVAGIVGMATALKENIENLDNNQNYLQKLTTRLLEKIKDLPYQLNGRDQDLLPGVLNLSFPGHDGEALLHQLDLMGICVSTGSACDSKRTVISHVLKEIGLKEDIARGTIRISLGTDNTEDDVDAIANALLKIVKKQTV